MCLYCSYPYFELQSDVIMISRVDEPEARFGSEYTIPDFQSLPKKFGWATKNERGYEIDETLCGTERPLRVISLGAGASGICLAKFLPEQLKNVSLSIYDKNPDFGGTWYENRYENILFLLF